MPIHFQLKLNTNTEHVNSLIVFFLCTDLCNVCVSVAQNEFTNEFQIYL